MKMPSSNAFWYGLPFSSFATGQLSPLTVTFEFASISHLPANVASAGDTITLSLRGSATGRLPGLVGGVAAIRHQATACDEVPKYVGGRKAMPRRQRDKLVTGLEKERVLANKEYPGALLSDGSEGNFEIAVARRRDHD